MNIFFSCAGRRAYLLEYFRQQLDSDDYIIAGDMQASAPALAFADVAVQLPPVADMDYIKKLLCICCEHHVDLLISLNDLELPKLSQNKKIFAEAGITVLVSAPDIIDICFDKFKTQAFINKIGLNSPLTLCHLEEARQALYERKLHYPLILKPRWGSGSIGIERIDDETELLPTYQYLQHKVTKSILADAGQSGNEILIQQCITGPEYGLDIINDLEGRHISVSVKRKLSMRAGETDKAITVHCPELSKIGRIIGSRLGHIGNLDCDILEQDGIYYVLELNPRFGGGFPFSYEAGVNLPLAILKWKRGQNVDPKILMAQPGLTFAKCDRLVER